MEAADAYAAGLVDGEGTITLSRNHRGANRIPVVSMTSTTPELVHAMRDEFGGQIRQHRTYRRNHSDSYIWSVRHDAAIRTIRRIRPYLRVSEKVRRADLVLTRYKAVTPRNGKYTPALLNARAAFEDEFFHPSTP